MSDNMKKLRDEIQELDKKRHMQNNQVQNVLGTYDQRIRDVENMVHANTTQIALHDAALDNLEKSHARTERVVENNTNVLQEVQKSFNTQVIAFTELNTTVKNGIKIAVFVIPTLSSLVAYIINLWIG